MKLAKSFFTFLVISISFSTSLIAQTISGNTQVGVSTFHSYTYSGSYSGGYRWEVVGGTISSSSGLTVNINWSSSAGTGTVKFFPSAFAFVPHELSVTKHANPPTPSTPSVSSNTCGNKTVTRGTPPSGITWYWQTSSGGVSTSNSSSTYTKTSSGYVYLRARRNVTGQWSSSASVYVTVNAYPSTPSTPSVSSNTCGNKTVTRGNPPSGITWYWQSSSGGTSTSNSSSTYTATSSQTVYLRARNNSSGCWSSSSSSRSVTVNHAPSAPSISGTSMCGSGNAILIVSGYSQNQLAPFKWYTSASGGSPFASGIASINQSVSSTTSYYVSQYNESSLCESSRTQVTVTVQQPSHTTGSAESHCETEVSVPLTGQPPYTGTWSINGPSSAIVLGNSLDMTVLTPGQTYQLTFTYANGICSSNTFKKDFYVEPMSVSGTISGDNVRCGSGASTFTLSGYTGTVDKWESRYKDGAGSWSGWSTITDTDNTLSVSPSLTEWASGVRTYEIKATVQSGSCNPVTTTKQITIDPTSVGGTVSGGIEEFGVSSGSLTLGGQTGAIQRWEQSTDGGSNWSTISHTSNTYSYTNVLQTTLYRAVVKSGVCSEAISANAEITILPVPTVDLGLSQNIRPGQSTTLAASAGHTNYEWFRNNVQVQNGSNNQLVVSSPGTYKVTVTSSGGALYTTGNAIIANQLESNQNAVITYTFREAVTSANSDPFLYDKDEVNISASIMDGLGRPKQQVVLEQSPSGSDMIAPVEYDEYGREKKKYLPYPETDLSQLYKPDALKATYAESDHYDYYKNVSSYADTTAFSETRFEASPLNRPLEQGSPGGKWQIGQNTVTFHYDIADSAEVIDWEFDVLLDSPKAVYGPGEVYENTTTDEDGNQTKEYTNKRGQTVLKKSQIDGSNWAETYYIYDVYGQLSVVLPPEATNRLASEFFGQTSATRTDFLNTWAFLYTYDGRNRMTMKKVPGADSVFMVYDRWDRLVLTQDGVQRTTNSWLFTKYDELNRPVMTGLATIAGTTATVRDSVQGATQRAESFDAAGTNEYTDVTFPPNDSIDNYLTVTYYDNYDWDNSGLTFTNPTGLTQQTAVKGQVTGTLTKTGNGAWIKSASYYDEKYRVIETQSTNHLGGTDVVTNYYDFIGQVTKSVSSHNNGSNTTGITRTFEYDHAGRLLKTHHEMTEEVMWTDLDGVSANGNNLEKTGANGYSTGGAASIQRLGNGQDGYVEFKVEDLYRILVGFSDENTDAHYNTIDYCVHTTTSGSIMAYASGSYKGTIGTYAIGDVLKVKRVNGVVSIEHNGTTIYTFVNPSNVSMLVDVASHNTGDQINDVKLSIMQLLSENTYDELGQLEQKDLHDNAEQSLDYTYNIRGWLTSINESDLSVSNDGDLFGMELFYDAVDASGDISNATYFNGNISAMKWSTWNDQEWYNTEERAYRFDYDKLNRLENAYSNMNTAGWKVTNDYRGEYSYDRNGNIQALERRNNKGSHIDSLAYTYTGNQLDRVTDNASDSLGFHDKHTGSIDYAYDANGNMVKDRNKEIDSIYYNHLNLPVLVDFETPGDSIEYLYDAAGIKLQQKVWQDDTLRKTSDYVGEFIYENGELQLLQHEEGRVIPILDLVPVQVQTSGIQAQLTLDGDANDDSGNSRNGTVNNAVLTTGRDGSTNGAYSFDWINHYIDMTAHDDYFKTLTEGTISVWFKLDSLKTGTLFGMGDTTTDFFNIYVGGSDIVGSVANESIVFIFNQGGSAPLYGAVTNGSYYYNDEQWHHLVYKVSGSGNELYVDGVKQAITYIEGNAQTSGYFLNVPSDGMALGKRFYPSSTYPLMGGAVDEFNIFSRALSTDEIKALANGARVGESADMMKITGFDYQYHLKDHLGNVRLTFSTTPENYTVVATMETENDAAESEIFSNLDTRIVTSANTTVGGNEASVTNVTDPIGPLAFLTVNKGDTVSLSVNAYAQGGSGHTSPIAESALISALQSATNVTSTLGEAANTALNSGISAAIGVLGAGGSSNDNVVGAYLNYIFFDRDMSYVSAGFQQISSAANWAVENISINDRVMDRDGYLMAYVSYESGSSINAFFDDFTIYHGKTNVVSTQDYYPFGLTFNESMRVASAEQRYLFNGVEKNTVTNNYQTLFRGYDPSIGRFMQIDPMADFVSGITPYQFGFDNPVNFTDPDGLLFGNKEDRQRRRRARQNRRAARKRRRYFARKHWRMSRPSTPSTSSGNTQLATIEPPSFDKPTIEWPGKKERPDLIARREYPKPPPEKRRPVPFAAGDEVLFEDNTFKGGTSDFLRPKGVKEKLKRTYSTLVLAPNMKVIIRATTNLSWGSHTGARVKGSDGRTLVQLLEDRAEAVKNALIELGVPANQIELGPRPLYGDLDGMDRSSFQLEFEKKK